MKRKIYIAALKIALALWTMASVLLLIGILLGDSLEVADFVLWGTLSLPALLFLHLLRKSRTPKVNMQSEIAGIRQLGKKKKERSSMIQEGSKPSKIGKMAVSVQIKSRERPADETKISKLGKRATALSKSGDWNEATECLKQVKRLTPTVRTEYPISHYLRLPLFLQKAGRFDESMKEFYELIDFVSQEGKPKHYDKVAWQAAVHGRLSTIYDKMRLACVREGRKAEAESFAQESSYHNEKWEELFAESHPNM